MNLVRTLRVAILTVAGCALPAASASARTFVLTDEDCLLIASIADTAPRLGWAGIMNAPAEFANYGMDLYPGKSSFLIAYPLDRIPAGQKISKAELTIPFSLVYPAAGTHLSVRRLLKEWGPGVSHELRMARPEKLRWHTPGARGVGQDRAAKPTASTVIKGAGETTVNVTEDIELWYSGAAKNYGWAITCDDPDSSIRLQSPFYSSPKGFKLRITYEPQ